MSQMTDSRGFRSGAALSVLLLLAATALWLQPATQQFGVTLIVLISLAMLLSAATGLRVSLLALRSEFFGNVVSLLHQSQPTFSPFPACASRR